MVRHTYQSPTLQVDLCEPKPPLQLFTTPFASLELSFEADAELYAFAQVEAIIDQETEAHAIGGHRGKEAKKA